MVKPGQVYMSRQGPEHLRPQYHVLAVYDTHVWTLLIYPGIPAARQPKEPRTDTTGFYEHCILVYDGSDA